MPKQHTIALHTVDGVALTTYASDGQARPESLVFVHGGIHGAWSWAQWQQWFANCGWKSIAFDWYSHGESRQLPVEEWTRRGIAEVAEEIGIACRSAGGRPVLVAHSMGGLAALLYAVANPGALTALVLLTPIVPSSFADEALEMPIDMTQPWPVPPAEVARALFFSGVDDVTAGQIYAKLQPESPQAVFEATRFTVDADVAGLHVPTYVVAAESDQLVPAHYVTALASAIGAETLVLPAAGHGVPHDPGWQKVAEKIEGWLATVLEDDPATR